jgi:hypothetical protein
MVLPEMSDVLPLKRGRKIKPLAERKNLKYQRDLPRKDKPLKAFTADPFRDNWR